MAKKKKKDKKKDKPMFHKRFASILIVLFWLVCLVPLFTILYLRYVEVDSDSLPSISMLENKEELLATTIYADDGVTSMGKFWKVNRTSVNYNEISPYLISALISTEDERFKTHSGIDTKAVIRAVVGMGESGGASTITQQLAKLIFTLKERAERREARQENSGQTKEEKKVEQMGSFERRLYEKVQENVIALRLERKYTKNEILTMYLNQFDFLYNAVGISSASKVYFNKKPADLSPDEAAMLVGMCKNPSLYNPYTFQVRDYREQIARVNKMNVEAVSDEEIKAHRKEDSLRAVKRRNTVLYKWFENSKKNNPALTSKITKEQYDSLKNTPIYTDYQSVDYKEGDAPYFREHLRSVVTKLLAERLPNGDFKYVKSNGEPYNIYEDGLRIYTTLNLELQEHAVKALRKHLKKNLQEPFTKNNRRSKHFPFAYDIKKETREVLMNSARKRSDRFYNMRQRNIPEEKIIASFDRPVPMKIFSWDGEIDTVMTPNDSIRYYKNIMQAGLVSIEPQTGFIKAYVGGIDINHFAYDHVALAKRQVGSTIKPFIYSAGMQFGVITPCETTPNIPYCVDVQKGPNPENMSSWCPGNAGEKLNGKPVSFAKGLANSMNNITVAVMSRMGGIAGPQAVAKLMESLNIHLRKEDIVPAMCLGVMDLSLLELASAQSAFVNKGIYTKPTGILRIEDRHGNVVFENEPQSTEAMSDDLAYATLKMMQGVVQFGTAASLRGTWRGDWGGVTEPTAGKTGTTQNNSDGWFMGLTPDLVTGVWVGAEDMAVRFRTMKWGQGARMALPIYGYMMQGVYKDPKIHISTENFEAPYGYVNSIYNCENKPKTGGDGSPDFGL